MEEWDFIGITTARYENMYNDILTVYLEQKLIGSIPMYRGRHNNKVFSIVKYPFENSETYISGYNAQFTINDRIYLLNVPYWTN